MKKVVLTMTEIWAETKPKVHKSKKKYDRKREKVVLRKDHLF